MTALALPSPDAPAAEWGRLAVSLPGWRWLPGMRAVDSTGEDTPGRVFDSSGFVVFEDQDRELTEERVYLHDVPDPDDPATAGCFLALLGPCEVGHDDTDPECGPWSVEIPAHFRMGVTIGRAAISVAAANGRWPGGGA